MARASHSLREASTSHCLDNVTVVRPFMFKDTFSVMSTATLTYVLIETSTSQVVARGNQVGTAHLRGKVGDTFELGSK